MKTTSGSASLFERAGKSIPGGVNSPVRAFKSVGGTPVFFKRATGAYMYDTDGNEYIDYINSWGPMIMGHAYQPVIEAMCKAAENSTSFGAPTEAEIEIAELIQTMAPNVDLIRMVNSGTEACMSAIRLARGFTGRNKILKFEGCYHGHADSFLVKAGSGVATFNIQTVPGVTAGVANDTLTAAYNDLEAVKEIVSLHDNEIAAIIIEPVAGNMGCIPPKDGFLEGLREICDQHNIVLIFDEVMTGFRLAPGGAQQRLGINADLMTYGKVIGAGMPVGAFAGKKEIMEMVAPVGKVYQAGTLSGNPVAMAAGYTLLKMLNENPSIYNSIDSKTDYLKSGLNDVLTESGVPFQINSLGSMISVHFSENAVTDFSSAQQADIDRFNKYFHFMLDAGIYLPPSAYETWFISEALSYGDIDRTIDVTRDFLKY